MDYSTIIAFHQNRTLVEMVLPRAVDWEALYGEKTLSVTLSDVETGVVLVAEQFPASLVRGLTGGEMLITSRWFQIWQ